jgi:sugar phosphate isomerase/epimerase
VRSGLDPIECLKKAKERIITLHLKDVIESGKPEARDVPLGMGKANYTAVLEELYAWKFRGVMTIEYEHLSDQLVQDVAQCVKFVEDFAASVKSR